MTRVSEVHRTAFVTGASTGLGRAFTEMLLAEGVRVWVPRVTRTARDLAAKHPSAFTPVALELRDGTRAETIFQEADQAAGDSIS